MIDYQSSNPIILCFPPFTGGKFIGNCLSLSRLACPQDPSSAEHLLANPKDYPYRMNRILTTLPDASNMQRWHHYEFGDQQLYGPAFLSWSQGQISTMNELTKRLCKSDLRFFITNHAMDPSNLLKIWVNATIIIFVNTSKFQKICIDKKSKIKNIALDKINGNYCQEKYNSLAGVDWPSWQDFENAGYDINQFDTLQSIKEEIWHFYHRLDNNNQVLLFDVDSCIFDQKSFLNSIAKLYRALNFDDFNPDLIDYFYQKYIALHI